MSQESYLSLTQFLERQVHLLRQPFKLDSKLERLVDNEEYSRREMRQALQTINAKVSSHYQKTFSKQAIAQVADQIQELREESSAEKRSALRSVVGIDVPVDINTDYKLYILDDIMEQVKDLPEVDDEDYEEYNEQRVELLGKVNQIEELKKKIEMVKNYQELVSAKVGDRSTIQRNIPVAGRDELREEMTKLRVILEKLNNLSGSKKAKLKKLLKDGGVVL